TRHALNPIRQWCFFDEHEIVDKLDDLRRTTVTKFIPTTIVNGSREERSGMIRVQTPLVTRAPGFASKALIGLAALAALTFVVLAALPYVAMLGSQEVAQKTLQPQQFLYWPRRGWLLTHIAGGLVALLSGPLQLWLGVHNRAMHVHRRMGIIYMI